MHPCVVPVNANCSVTGDPPRNSQLALLPYVSQRRYPEGFVPLSCRGWHSCYETGCTETVRWCVLAVILCGELL